MMNTIHVGDALDVLRTLPDESVQCVVTSPPYFGLRDYGHDGQIGLESTPDEFVAALVEVFREVRRVLRDDGTVWLNLGDSYAGGGGHSPNAPSSAHSKSGKYGMALKEGGIKPVGNIKPKDLIGIPWRVAFALQADGWWLRQDIIWHKPNPMPESVTDRCTKAHEYIFLLSKSARYYYDHEAIKEKSVCEAGTAGDWDGNIDFNLPNGETRFGKPNLGGSVDGKRNKRDVWQVNTKPFTEAHFAVYPPELIEPCVLAGSAEGDTVLDPFSGAGTTGVVALAKRRTYIGIELNPTYAEMAARRIRDEAPMFNAVKIETR